MASPTNGQLFVFSPANILLTAQATSYGSANVLNVSFSNQLVNLGSGIKTSNSGSSSMWQALWLDVTKGTYTVTVNASDDQGNTASDSVAIVVNGMPVASLLTPTNHQLFQVVANSTLTAAGWGPGNGTNVQVKFYSSNVSPPSL